jgi:hypothetical protein
MRESPKGNKSKRITKQRTSQSKAREGANDVANKGHKDEEGRKRYIRQIADTENNDRPTHQRKENFRARKINMNNENEWSDRFA